MNYSIDYYILYMRDPVLRQYSYEFLRGTGGEELVKHMDIAIYSVMSGENDSEIIYIASKGDGELLDQFRGTLVSLNNSLYDRLYSSPMVFNGYKYWFIGNAAELNGRYYDLYLMTSDNNDHVILLLSRGRGLGNNVLLEFMENTLDTLVNHNGLNSIDKSVGELAENIASEYRGLGIVVKLYRDTKAYVFIRYNMDKKLDGYLVIDKTGWRKIGETRVLKLYVGELRGYIDLEIVSPKTVVDKNNYLLIKTMFNIK